MNYQPGDIVRVGKGYQHWTVQRTLSTGELVLQSDPGRADIAGGSSRSKTVNPSRVTRLFTVQEVEQRRIESAKKMEWDRKVEAKAKKLGVDLRHCPGCRDKVEWAVTRDEEGENL